SRARSPGGRRASRAPRSLPGVTSSSYAARRRPAPLPPVSHGASPTRLSEVALMTWDAVPWFVGGGAEHSPEVARLLAYAATGGAEGIVLPTDLRVAPLSAPGSGVRVLPGAAPVRTRASGGALQTYVARLPVANTVSISATGSGAGRSDLIVARIEDPYVAGTPYQEPENPASGPYVFTRVIS